MYDDEVRKWIAGVGVDSIGKKLVNSKEAPPTFDQPKMTLEKLLEYGNMLVQEQENVKRVQLADKYLSDAALGDANKDAMERGNFYGICLILPCLLRDHLAGIRRICLFYCLDLKLYSKAISEFEIS